LVVQGESDKRLHGRVRKRTGLRRVISLRKIAQSEKTSTGRNRVPIRFAGSQSLKQIKLSPQAVKSREGEGENKGTEPKNCWVAGGNYRRKGGNKKEGKGGWGSKERVGDMIPQLKK